ncbi:MAG: type I methionyl aminopeptidase [Candidatus Paceibacterota bacterium]|jgi:methionyl aminopeptidase|nr:type I methionyl aminopeptidase [Candidatus Paceibacterota bacterium]MDD4830770.1 type I methionyl aminopeptidase [Candidatus Paceibacterota bacterium]MDD4875308.1 type I methionyl aminopeptidase [Candidatus Paceibacterota bacterium]
MIHIKTSEEIKIMAEAGQILAEIMKNLLKEAKPGVATKDIDRLAESLILKRGAKCSFKGYGGFPACSCLSINEEIVHGVPSGRKLEEGSVLSLDLGLFHKGYHSDMAVTVPIGNIDFEVKRLLKAGKKALKRGIKLSRVGNTFGDISNTIQRYVEGQGFNVARDLCGHGIGKNLHEDPEILNYGKRGRGAKIQEGMVFCLEPMVVVGGGEIKLGKNRQTYETKDGSLSVHFEHTIAVTKEGTKILTDMGDSEDLS